MCICHPVDFHGSEAWCHPHPIDARFEFGPGSDVLGFVFSQVLLLGWGGGVRWVNEEGVSQPIPVTVWPRLPPTSLFGRTRVESERAVYSPLHMRLHLLVAHRRIGLRCPLPAAT